MPENIGAVGTEAIAVDNSQTQENTQQNQQAEPGQTEPKKTPVAAKPPEAPKRHKLKVDGREEEVDEPELIRRAQIVTAANKRMQDIAKKQENVAQFLKTVKENPIAALMDPALGLTKEEVKKFFEQWYKKEIIDVEMLTPEQRRLRDYEEKDRQRAEEDKRAAAKAQEAKHAEEAKHWMGEYEKQIVKGLESKNLPKTTSTVRAMAAYMERANKAGIEVPIETIASLVHQDKVSDAQHLVSAMSGEQLIQFFGEEVINRLRKADLARLRGGKTPAQPKQAQPAPGSEPNKGQGKPISMAEARNYFDNLK